ncbi:leucine--tRNA ligase [Pedobacter boryungensis]|uniref:Leucine--tRNA ligase n=1 Tax=Pedobacter boryungensis TaxID=869962 RepID=A0ABX2DHT4_9SPHI|nr:leucine--tRNA ligase [Pedobacter boryungensis]NQX33099.1 leucine--tRNA ligase [Pedobacter boryungensis]
MDYQFAAIEQKWQKFWAENQTFKAETNSNKPKYYVLDMFPYPSGAGLHVGHPLGYIASDIFSRYKRLKGFNVLHPMGYDSFGLPAEQYAIQTGQHPAITTEANIATYRRQLDQIGFSFDWSREVRTSESSYYKWTQWIFMQLFNSWYNLETDKAEDITTLIEKFNAAGSANVKAVCDEDVKNFMPSDWAAFTDEEKQVELLKYRLTYLKESTVNWCPALGTVLANDEVKDGFSERGGYPVEQKKMMQWSMRISAYAERLLQGLNTIDWPEPVKEMQRNWIGKSVGASVIFPISLTPTLSAGEGADNYGYETADPLLWEILKTNARVNRVNQTEAEDTLWQKIRNNQTGHKIRRQHPIGSYIADFICLNKRLIIEVDGGYHLEIQENDKIRTEALNQLGFDVIRFSNYEVLSDINLVSEKIKTELEGRPDIATKKVSNLSSLSFGEGRGEAGIEVFTTRVDTIFGVSFIVLAPEHELVQALTTEAQKEDIEKYIAQTKKKSELDRMADTKTVSGAFTGSYVINPVNNELVPIWIADYVLAGYGTGAVMGVPSGDQRDWLFAKHFNLPIIQILDAQKDIEVEADPTKEGRYINSDFINNLGYKEAISYLNHWLEREGVGKAKVNYRMRDAIFGRQRYWGEPIPVYFKDGLPYLIKEEELPLLLPEIDKYLPTESGEPPLGRATDWSYEKQYEYELSTMPGWAGSSWYWYRYMDAQNENKFASKDAIAYWKDVDLYIGGSEHATGHLLYSRFWNKFLKDLGYVNEEEPFKKLINQGMIQGRSNFVYRVVDEEGKGTNTLVSYGLRKDYKTSALHVDVNIVENEILNVNKFKEFRPEFANAEFILENGKYICGVEVEKMSKSKFNVVNPDDLIKSYGADTLRMYEMFLGPLEQSKPWNTNGIEGVFKFLRKFWRLFHNEEWVFHVDDSIPTKAELKALHKIIKKVQDDVERFSFNTSVSSFMIAVNELTDLKCKNRQVLEDLVVVLSPYAPHICEELWSLLGNTDLSNTPYPTFNPAYLQEAEFAYPISINGKMRMNLNLSLSLEQDQATEIVLANDQVQGYLEGKTPKKIIFVKGKIVNIVV